MGIEQLTELEIATSLFDMLIILGSILMGTKILFKYFSHKEISLVTTGLTWFFFSIGWWGGAISFISVILYDKPLDLFFYLILVNTFNPLALICWVYSFCLLVYPRLKHLLVPIYILISIISEIFLFVFLIITPEIVGRLSKTYYLNPGIYQLTFQVFAMSSVLITGILLAIKSLKSEKPIIRLRGKLLLAGFVSLSLSLVLEAIINVTLIEFIFIRILLLSGLLEFYTGFFLPKKITNRLRIKTP